MNGKKSKLWYVSFPDSTTTEAVKRFLDNLVDFVGEKLSEHPMLGFVVLTLTLSCALPVGLAFVIFVVMSFAFTFTGFLVVQGKINYLFIYLVQKIAENQLICLVPGTLLAVACICLFSCLLSMILVVSIAAVVLYLFYFAAVKIIKVMSNCEQMKAFTLSMVPLLTNPKDNFQVSTSVTSGTAAQD